MLTPKTFLNVPFAQKDAAKALGARWDAANKKWFVPAGKDIAAFAQWMMDAELALASSKTIVSKAKINRPPVNNSAQPKSAAGVFTHPTIADFIPYSGDAAPWD